MKFAHEFQDKLKEEPFPEYWLRSAVPYGELKKVIKKLTVELKSLGLDPATLNQLMPKPDQRHISGRRGSSVEIQYDLDGDRLGIRPKLTLLVQMEDGLTMDAKLSPETREYLKSLVAQNPQLGSPSNFQNDPSVLENVKNEQDLSRVPTSSSSVLTPGSEPRSSVQRVEIPLTFDTKFFELLNEDVTGLEALQVKEQQALIEEISSLSKDVAILSKPSRFRKSDMYRWRELFDVYLQANIFFSTNELDHGSRDSQLAAKQLNWFQSEVIRRDLVSKFKLPASHRALERFVAVNITLLRNMQFHEINQKAIGKILKKFAKRTQLGAMQIFSRFSQPELNLPKRMSKAVSSQVSQELVSTIPQLNDYLCPICFSVAWRPIRLACKHIFCIGCTLEFQRKKARKCPLCREEVVMLADIDSIDSDMSAFLKKYFPKEVISKQMEHETKMGSEDFGVLYKHPGRRRTRIGLLI